MKAKLPDPLEAYFSAVNRGAVDAMLATFETDATFPGSPVRLRYSFTVDAGRITRLEIT